MLLATNSKYFFNPKTSKEVNVLKVTKYYCIIILLPEASFGLRVLSLPASVPPSVRQSVRPSVRHQVCPCDNYWTVQARITKLGPEVQNNLVKIPNVLWDNWPWPSRSNWTPKSKFTPFWACPCHNSPPIEFPNLAQNAIGFNHGLLWCVKYMARGTSVTTKSDGEAGGFCVDRRPEGHVFHTPRQAMIKTFYSTLHCGEICPYFSKMLP